MIDDMYRVKYRKDQTNAGTKIDDAIPHCKFLNKNLTKNFYYRCASRL